MKQFLVILNLLATAIMFGLIALVPYLNIATLGTEISRMEKQQVFHQPNLDAYLNGHNAMADKLDHHNDLAHYLYGLIFTASPFVAAACIVFLANAIVIAVCWNRQPWKTMDHSKNE
jgi:hypothetical protein